MCAGQNRQICRCVLKPELKPKKKEEKLCVPHTFGQCHRTEIINIHHANIHIHIGGQNVRPGNCAAIVNQYVHLAAFVENFRRLSAQRSNILQIQYNCLRLIDGHIVRSIRCQLRTNTIEFVFAAWHQHHFAASIVECVRQRLAQCRRCAGYDNHLQEQAD